MSKELRGRLGEVVSLLPLPSQDASVESVEHSGSGYNVVLRLVGVRHAVRFRSEQRFGLDLFVPGSPSPVHATVRPVRAIGVLEAFELVEIGAMDRLTLAEYLDALRASRPVTGHVRSSHPGTLSVRA